MPSTISPYPVSIKKQKKAAKELLHAAHKIYLYRRDVTSEKDLADLDDAVGELDQLYRSKEAEAEQFSPKLDRVDALLRKIGGKMYPKTFWNDNIEVALVAAIIVIGIRTFFFQPFIIPTNSMYPTYNGMTYTVYEPSEPGPGAASKIFRLATIGARHKSLVPEVSGDVKLLVFKDPRTGKPSLARKVRGGVNKNGILPTVKDEYSFLIAGQIHTLTVPQSFDMQGVLMEAFNQEELHPVNEPASESGIALQLNAEAVAGEPLLRFDVKIGDALFVDRISYHFKQPEVGDPFVFRTDEILNAVGEATGDYTPKYYIKRLVGTEGELLEIKDFTLYADGQPREGADAFDRNSEQFGEYSGYINQGLLGEDLQMLVPEDSYVALGDNSANSADSRYWGYVPQESVIGKAFFIYYPFTKRWGLAE